MDGECASLLPRVCEVLAASGSSLPDDTSLEKLLDWFTGLSKTGGSLLESAPCLLEFIPTVVNNTALDTGVLSFAVRLAGLIAAGEDGFNALQQRSLLDLVFNLQHWQDAGLWDDPCIRIGWIQGLRNMLQHPKALRFLVQSDLTRLLLQLQTDTSLFVASAAGQVLAHILLHFQPPWSSRRDGVNETADDHSVDYSAVVVPISQYIKESLAPEVTGQHRQGVQLLRLLALLLAQARPPLRDTLLRTVGDSLKELAAAGCSQLTLPLMDVILAAHSGFGADEPDERVSCLLSSMFNTNKPADLIPAAAAFLCRGLQDSVHSVWTARMLLLPLDIITGRSLLGFNDLADEHRVSTAEQLKSKTSCISLLCVCLTNTPHVTVLPARVLPCPPASIVTAVLTVLRICSGQSSSSSPPTTGCAEVHRNVIGCGKVQKCALEALTALSCCPGGQEKTDDVFTLLLQYLNNPESDPTVLHKSYQALMRWMSDCTNMSALTDQLRQDLFAVARKRVCDVRWEVRDSTVEFLGKAAGVLTSPAEVPEGLLVNAAPLLKEALQDTESYVRASAVSALAQTQVPSWKQGAALTQQQTETVTQLLEMLSQDTEGFARRAVIQFFITWFSATTSHAPPASSAPSLLMNSVRSVLSVGSTDLDWEVKVHTLELAQLLLDEAFLAQRGKTPPVHPYARVPEQTCTLHTHNGTHSASAESGLAGALTGLVELGVVSALLSGLVDCDRPVALKACRLLIRLRDAVCPVSPGTLDATAAVATVTSVSCELPAWSWGQEIRTILENQTSDGANKACVTAPSSAGSEQDGGDGVHVGVCEVLTSLGLDERLEVLSQSSDHVHNSPLSLLQDILAATAAHTHADTQPGQEVIVDCY